MLDFKKRERERERERSSSLFNICIDSTLKILIFDNFMLS